MVQIRFIQELIVDTPYLGYTNADVKKSFEGFHEVRQLLALSQQLLDVFLGLIKVFSLYQAALHGDLHAGS